jgi:hypothetical protein
MMGTARLAEGVLEEDHLGGLEEDVDRGIRAAKEVMDRREARAVVRLLLHRARRAEVRMRSDEEMGHGHMIQDIGQLCSSFRP